MGRKTLPLRPGATIHEAEEARRVDNPRDFHRSVLTEQEFMNIELERRRFILKDFLVEESLTIVNGYRGFGKSWFCLAIANEVTWGGKVGPWKVEQSVNTLLVDGEMALPMIQERLKLMNGGRKVGDKPSKLFIYPEAYAYRIGLKRADILDARWRSALSDMVVDLGVRLLVLDNLSSLAPGIDENEKTPFDPVNRWLLELRFKGVSIVMAHHTGKGGEQRGTSAHEDHVDLALLLGKPAGWKKDDGCKFSVTATKDRDFVMKGYGCTLVLAEDENGRMVFCIAEKTGLELAIELIKRDPDMTTKEAKAAGIAERTYYRAKQKIEGGA